MSHGYKIKIDLTNMTSNIINKKSNKSCNILTFNRYAKSYIKSDKNNINSKRGLLKINNIRILRILTIVNKYTELNGDENNRLLYFITLKKNASHVPDIYEYNKTFILNDGEYYGYVLKNQDCENCINCYGCKNCVDCEDCFGCTDSFDCYNGINLVTCNSCDDCSKCEQCDNCNICTRMISCDNCFSCDNCDQCTDCSQCKSCVNCLRCVKCIKCNSCTECSDMNNRTNLKC